MEKLNAEQVKKALECLTKAKDVYCKDCAYQVYGGLQCQVQAVRDALSLINELTFENRQLEAQNWNYRQCCDDTAKVRDKFDADAQRYKKKVKTIKADTVRKMQERLKAHFDTYTDEDEATSLYMRKVIDRIAKEMLEGENEGAE